MQPMFAVAMTLGSPVPPARASLFALQLLRNLRLQDRIGAGRAAAEVRIGDRQQLDGRAACSRSPRPARGSSCRAAACTANERRAFARSHVHRELRRDPRPFGGDDLDRIARELGDPCAPSRVCGIVAQQVPVVADHDAAAAGGDDDRLGALLDMRPPGVDVAPRDRARLVVLGQMIRTARRSSRRPATAIARDADPVEHARQSRRRCSAPARAARSRAAISMRRACRAAGQRRPRGASGIAAARSRGSKGFGEPPERERGAEQRPRQQAARAARFAARRRAASGQPGRRRCWRPMSTSRP